MAKRRRTAMLSSALLLLWLVFLKCKYRWRPVNHPNGQRQCDHKEADTPCRNEPHGTKPKASEDKPNRAEPKWTLRNCAFPHHDLTVDNLCLEFSRPISECLNLRHLMQKRDAKWNGDYKRHQHI